MFTVRGMVVAVGPVAVKPDGTTFDWVNFAQVGGQALTLSNVLVVAADEDLIYRCATGVFDFEGDANASMLCQVEHVDGSCGNVLERRLTI